MVPAARGDLRRVRLPLPGHVSVEGNLCPGRPRGRHGDVRRAFPRPSRRPPAHRRSNRVRVTEYNTSMPFSATLRSERFVFADLRDLFAKANEEKSGDALAGIAARSERERAAAKLALADVRLDDIVRDPLVEDDVS